MVYVINATPTTDALLYIPQYLMAGSGFTAQLVSSFKIGMGGWEASPVGKIPRAPASDLRDPLAPFLQDLDIFVDRNRTVKRYSSLGTLPDFTPTGGPGYYEGPLTASEQFFDSPSTLRVQCDFPSATAPTGSYEFWEIGVFSPHPDGIGGHQLMLAYGTFPKQSHINNLEIHVRLSFGSL